MMNLFTKTFCIAALAMCLIPAGLASADATPQEKAAFNKLISQRNTLHRKLVSLDRSAADRMKRGEDATGVHADQISVQDQLDQISLRVDLMATRHGLRIPPLPGSQADAVALDPKTQADRTARRAFERGVSRTKLELRRQTRVILKSIDFTDFLKEG